VTTSNASVLSALAALFAACAHSASAPAEMAAPPAPNKLWCGPIACPAWLSNEPAAARPLPLRERCALLSKVLMFQPLSLVGRPLSAYETSQQKNIGRIDDRVAVAVSLRPADAAENQLERSWFSAGETCGAGLLVLAPSPTQGDAEEVSSIFKLSLSARDPERPNVFEFTLTAEPLQPEAATSAFKTLAGRAERARDAGPDSWTIVVQASVSSADALVD
jgi:hypothetical protein